MIVLRYARNLVDGEGFVFNAGERILGVTTPLHTLISTIFVALGEDRAPAVQNIVGVIFLVLEAWLAARLVKRTHSALLGFLVGLLLLTNLNFNYLYFGMETHLFAFLILLSHYLFMERKELLNGIVLGLAFLTRYDAALLSLLIGLAYLFERKKFPLKLTSGFFLTTSPWLLFSLVYFHSILPQSLGAKKDYYPVFGYIHFVFDYYQTYFSRLAGVFTSYDVIKSIAATGFPLAAAAGTWALVRINPGYTVLIGYAALQVCIYAVLGPDPAFYWHYYTLNPVLTILFAVGVFGLLRAVTRFVFGVSGLSRTDSRALSARTEAILAALLMIAIGLGTANLSRQLEYKFELDPHSKQLYAISHWLNEHYDDQTSLLQPSIGILGYATRLRIIDHAGLVTPGLYYYDSSNHTPMTEVLRRHQPDLILIPEGEARDLESTDYQVIKTFHDPNAYLLYQRPGL